MSQLSHLAAFVAVARERNFRRAATRAGASPSGLSAAVRGLEEAMGVRLLHRTTRSVTPTEAGRALLQRLGPALDEVEAALAAMQAFRDTPAGELRINSASGPARLQLAPLVGPFLAAHPRVRLVIEEDNGFVDIVAAGFDAGVRYRESLPLDMMAVPLGPPQRYVAVAAPVHLARHGVPAAPQALRGRPLIGHRFPSGAVLPWEFERDGERLVFPPEGPLEVTSAEVALQAAADGLGFAFTFDGFAAPWLARGALVEVLREWSTPFEGPLLYWPGRRLPPGPLRALVDWLRARHRASPSIPQAGRAI